MARTRYVRPDFFEDVKVSSLPIHTRLFYVGLWCFMDRNGLVEDEPKIIRKNIFPYDEFSLSDISKMIDALVSIGCLKKGEYEGKGYLYCKGLAKHQHFHKDEKPKYTIPMEIFNLDNKTPPKHGANTVQAPLEHQSSTYAAGRVTENGERVTENGVTSEPNKDLGSLGPILQFSNDSTLDLILKEITHKVQISWIQAYHDVDWLKQEMKKANAWIVCNPKKAPKDLKKFLNNWFSRGFEEFRKTIKSNKGGTGYDARNLIKPDPYDIGGV